MVTTELTGAEEVAWDLSDLYESPDDPALEADVADAEGSAAAFRERYRGTVASLDAAGLAEAVAERERIESAVDRALTYAHLNFATNMGDPARGALVARLQEKAAVLETQLLFFGLEWAALDDDAADALLADPALDHWRHFLRSLRKYRPHLLSEPEERILTEKTVSGSSAWARLYEELLGSLRVDLDGEEVSLETAMARLYSAERDVRRTAAEAVTGALEPGLRTRTYVLNTILLDKSIDDRLRGYATWISARNLANETTDDAVQALVDATTARYDVPQRYYRLKARLLGLDRLAHYDRMAPVAETTAKLAWDEARAVVVGAYADFSAEAGEIVDGFFARRWIDAPVRADKRTGAFCATTVPGVHPYVLLNYTGDRRAVLTLAHELGHGLHGVMAQPLGLFNASTPLTTAETASVFGEALTFKRLLAAEDDPRRKLDLLTGRIEDAIATVFRQIAMNRFEHAVHTERRTQGEISSERFAELWLECQTELFGDSVDTTGYGSWWSYVNHFAAVPGYVYAYAYGYLFALSIFRAYEREGDALVEPYLQLLRAGGSKAPEELARIVGLDLTDAAIWASGIDALADELDEAERLAAEIGLG
ncbi:oligoendopeptidase, pepF/M3 family [Gaiella occulta]|uniref:Oligoendopeptidase, pepF/M3 family n=1 Tax=Gaiella occulta TaxID=1002870 RepID=A0A7M2YUM8_9ACTN|nr:M3 family oligoendopeptidase [Gaiella occulta]RDI73705.1 oligoendopeptidase, pepF/M3 family [Gaiella occulta]